MQGPFLLTPVTKKCSKTGLENVVFLNKDFSERSENSLPQAGMAKGIYLVDIAFIENGSSGMF